MVEDEALEQADSSNTVSTSRARKAPPRPSSAIPIDLSSAHGSHSLPSTMGTPASQVRQASWSHPIAREGERGGAVEGYGLITVGPRNPKQLPLHRRLLRAQCQSQDPWRRARCQRPSPRRGS